MSRSIAPMCFYCARESPPSDRPISEVGFGWRCEAYQDGIPDAIIDWEFDHTTGYPGDHGLQFVPKDPVAERAYMRAKMWVAERREARQRESRTAPEMPNGRWEMLQRYVASVKTNEEAFPVRVVNFFLNEAFASNARAVVFTCGRKHIKVQLLGDGLVEHFVQLQKKLWTSIVNVIRLRAGIDTSGCTSLQHGEMRFGELTLAVTIQRTKRCETASVRIPPHDRGESAASPEPES